MKLLFITNTIQTMSGASKIIRFVASEMSNKFEDVGILSIMDTDQKNEVGNCKVYPLGCNEGKKGIWRIEARKRIRDFVKEYQPDLICAFVADACFMVRWATLGLPVKIVSCDRGDPQADGWLWSHLSGWAYRHSDACVFQLRQVRDFFGEETLPASYIIPNPFVPVNVELVPFENREKTIVSSGRFTEQKGFDVLIRAFEKVYAKHPEYKLIIYGDGPLKDEHWQLVEELHLSDAVEFPGFVSNVSERIKNAGVYCLPSRYEGIPNALLEAMALGLTSVAADCTPGGAEFLTDGGRRGLLVSKDDADALAEALIKCIEDKELARKLAERAAEVRTLFAPDVIALQWENVFIETSKKD